MRLLLFCFLFPLAVQGQKLLLIDRNMMKPVRAAETFSIDQLAAGVFPIYYDDAGRLIEESKIVARAMIENKHMNLGNAIEGHSSFIVRSSRQGGKTLYRLSVNTKSNSLGTSIVLVGYEDPKRALKRLNKFIDYLRNNLAAVEQ